MEKLLFVVEKEYESTRSDVFLANHIDNFSREKLRDVFENGGVMIEKIVIKPSRRLKTGEKISVEVPEIIKTNVEAENIPIDIVYQDEDIVIVNKPQGMVVHPAAGNQNATLVNALLYHIDTLSGINGVIRPGIVHRIDKDTSGLLVVAKNDKAHKCLASQFAVHSITRRYSAIVHGRMENNEGTIDAPIGRDINNRKAFCVTPKNSKRAVTHYRVNKVYEDYTHIDISLETGRTHQIRVHMKYIRHPVVGDKLYSYDDKYDRMFSGQLLCAYKLGFMHPTSGKYVEFECPLPDSFSVILDN